MTKELEQAQELILKAEEKNQRECSEELGKVLAKYGYTLQTTPVQIVFTKK